MEICMTIEQLQEYLAQCDEPTWEGLCEFCSEPNAHVAEPMRGIINSIFGWG